MSLELPFGYKPVRALSNVDVRYGPYISINEALSGTSGTRKQGLTVGVIENDEVVEYWFRDGIEDSDLVKKIGDTLNESIHSASGSTSLNDDDEFTYVDSTNNWILRKINWNNIKSILDTIYSRFSGSYKDLTDKPDDVTELSGHTATELSDINDSGSGNIITDIERGKIDYYVTPEMFNAEGDGSTDDSQAFQDMFDSIDINNPKKILLSDKVYLINSTVNLPEIKSGSPYLIIEGNSTTLKTTSDDVTIFNRIPSDQSTASVWVSASIHISGIKFIGNGSLNQKGIFLGATYGSSIRDCSFNDFEIGVQIQFGLMTLIENCLANGCDKHFELSYGKEWGGGTSTSQSNSSTIRNVRVYSKTDA
ncbi:MAG: hypothetical protein ACOC2W_04580, partial [bacterium]